MHSFDNNVYREAFFFKARLWFSIETPIRKGKSNISIGNFRNKKGTGAEINGVLQMCLGSLLGARQSAIGQSFSLSQAGNGPRSLCKS